MKNAAAMERTDAGKPKLGEGRARGFHSGAPAAGPRLEDWGRRQGPGVLERVWRKLERRGGLAPPPL